MQSEGRLGEATARYRQQSVRLSDFESRAMRMAEEKKSLLSRSLADVRDQDEAVTLRDRKLAAQESRMQIQEEVVAQLRADHAESQRKALESEQRAVRAERKCRAFEVDAETSREHLRDHVQVSCAHFNYKRASDAEPKFRPVVCVYLSTHRLLLSVLLLVFTHPYKLYRGGLGN